MARNPGDIDKARRIQVLRDIISRWGSVGRKEAQELLENSLDVEKGSFSRSIYRDLEHLVNNNLLLVEYFSRDGSPLSKEDVENGKVKTYVSRWFSPDSKNKIRGEKILNTYGGSLYCPDLLKNDVSISDTRLTGETGIRSIFFNIGVKFLSINFDLEARPFELIVTRTKGELTADQRELVEKARGKRVVILQIPEPTISSLKSEEQLGHCSVIVSNESEITIRDNNSKNGTEYYKVTMEDAEAIMESGGGMGLQTLTQDWNTKTPESLIKNRIQSDSEVVELPIVCELSNRFQLIII